MEKVDIEKMQRIIHGAQRIRTTTASCKVQILARILSLKAPFK